MGELQAVAAGIPKSAADQMDAFSKLFGPGRNANDIRDIKNGPLISQDGTAGMYGLRIVLFGNPNDGSVTLMAPGAVTQLGGQWLLMNPSGTDEVYFLCLEKGGDRRYLRLNGGVIDLGPTPDQSARWHLVDAGNGNVRLWSSVPLPGGMRQYLSGFQGKVAPKDLLPFAAPADTETWKWDQSKQATGQAPPNQISTEAFWWGFHFVIPENVMPLLLAAGGVVAQIVAKIAPETGPAAPFVELAAAYIAAEINAMKTIDDAAGNKGLYISMCWFAPGIFIPTPR